MFFVNIFLYVFLPALIAGYFFIKKKQSYFKDRNIPHIPPSSLLLGNLTEVGKKHHFVDFLGTIYDKCKDKGVIAGFYSAYVPTILITDLEVVKHVTVKDFQYFTDRGMYVNEEVEPITGNLLQIGGEKWRFLRNKLSPAFTSGKIKMMFETISDKGESFVKVIEKASKNGSVNVKNLSTKFTVDIISSCAFGIEPNTLANENLDMVDIMNDINGEEGMSQLKFFLVSSYPKLAKLLKLGFFGVKINDFFQNFVRTTMKCREDNNVTRNDFLNMLIQMKNKDVIEGETSISSRKLTMDECAAQAFIFFLGGADTSSMVISYAILELGCNQEIQDKLRKEINEKIKSSNGEINYDNLQEMTYLNQVVNETLRMHVSGILFRQAVNDYKIPNTEFVIEKGTQVMIPNHAIHYDEKYWKNPLKFDPERFSTEESANRPNLAFMPFGNGPRNCIGMRFGLVNSNFGVATIIKNFKVSTDTTKTLLPIKMNPKLLNPEPIGGSWIKVEKL